MLRLAESHIAKVKTNFGIATGSDIRRHFLHPTYGNGANTRIMGYPFYCSERPEEPEEHGGNRRRILYHVLHTLPVN